MSADSYEVILRFSDAVEHKIRVPPGVSILEAALEHGVPVLYQCQSGSCGSCIGRVSAGQATMRSSIAASLLESERQEGLRLTCVCDASSDCTITFDYDSNAASSPQQASAFVDAVEWLADDVVKLVLELADGHWLDFKPGQFVQLKVPGSNNVRRYSIATTPQELPRLELLIRVLTNGVMSEYLRQHAKVDDVLELEGPFGSFFWREDMRAPHVFIAGGTGLAPLMSMLEVIRQKNSIKPDMLLSFGCRDSASLFYTEELALREQWMPKFEYRITVDNGPPPAATRLGDPVHRVTAEDVDSNTVAYLCGPPKMIEVAYEHLENLGVKSENIYAEQFVAS